MLSVDQYLSYTMEEIENETDIEIKNIIMKFREEELKAMSNNRLSRKIINENIDESIEDIIRKIDEYEFENSSSIVFPGDIVLVYPQYHEHRASKSITCDISGAIINPGSFYCQYQAFIENLSSGKKYVLKRTINTEIGNEGILPCNIQTLDDFDLKLQNSYDVDYGDYDYYAIAQRIGEGLSLRELKFSDNETKKIKRKLKQMKTKK